MEVIILAGGLGTRLRSVVQEVPKCMAPVQGRPFLAYLLDWLQMYSVDHVVFSVGYLNRFSILSGGANGLSPTISLRNRHPSVPAELSAWPWVSAARKRYMW